MKITGLGIDAVLSGPDRTGHDVTDPDAMART